MSSLSVKFTVTVVVILLNATFINGRKRDIAPIKDRIEDCPKPCRCQDEKVRCSHLPSTTEFSLPQSTKLL